MAAFNECNKNNRNSSDSHVQLSSVLDKQLRGKFFAIASLAAILACACADVSELSGYHYHPHHYSAPSHSYIPPAATAPEPVFAPAPAPAPVYQPAPAAAAPAPVYYQPAPAASQIYEQPAEDGYRYRTVRRRVYRQRRL
ncbi:PREDICTED: uncharacterized protein LOC108362518 [Rhagoletis zephyria]|uniref:uncharacterized protein LOC108362518 n=1 Tax=Rhagoletis zephyria TaxID=28612 RepID=UPI00081177B0|nr:PREDICTED: uncharacterized protein LOC108362518 [Rhagoletis zephyria]